MINAGGVIRIFVLDIEGKGQAERDAALHRIGDQLTEVWHRSREEGRPPLLVADQIADARIDVGARLSRITSRDRTGGRGS